MDKVKTKVKEFEWKKCLNRRLPITVWLPKYNLEKLRGDLSAGITVGIMIIPQSIAIATLAGLPPHYGLYAALTPGLIYCLLGTSKDVAFGPTVTMALFTSRFNATQHPVGAAALAFFVGLVLLAMTILKLGFVTKFMPSHVISGFVSAAAFVIMVSQIRPMFGYKSNASNFIDKIIDFFKYVKDTNPWDATLGLLCVLYLAIFFVISRTVLKRPLDSKSSKLKKISLKLLNGLCIARSALVCIISTVVAYIFYMYGHKNAFTLAGDLPSGFPKVDAPLHSVTLENNKTVTTVDFVSGFGASLIVLPLIQFIQSISIAKAFAKMHNYDIDSSQELFTLSVANIVGSFFGGLPVTGSFSRSAVNAMSGVRTPMAGAVACVLIFFAVSFLMPLFYYIPIATLAAMIIMAVVTMVDTQVPREIWKVRRIDLLPFAIAFFGTFYKLEMGVMIGAVVALLIMVSREMRPKQNVSFASETVVTVKFESSLAYPGMDTVKTRITKLMKSNACLKIIKIDLSNVRNADYGVIIALKSIADDIRAQGISLHFVNFCSENVRHGLVVAGVKLETDQDDDTVPSDLEMSSSAGRESRKDLCIDIEDGLEEKDCLVKKSVLDDVDDALDSDELADSDKLMNTKC